MTAREICALAFDDAGIAFAEDANDRNKNFYKGNVGTKRQNAVAGANATGEKKFDLEAHDRQHHHGHYDGGECKYREEAIQKGLISREAAYKNTGGSKAGKQPPQVTAEQLLKNGEEGGGVTAEELLRNPRRIETAQEGIKTEQKVSDTPVGEITTESAVQEAVVKELSEAAENGNADAVRALNNLKDFNDLKEEIGAFSRIENESDDALIDRFNELLERIDPEKFDERQRFSLSHLANFIKNRIEGELGREMEPENTNGKQVSNASGSEGAQGNRTEEVDAETGLPQYVGADGKVYVDASGLGILSSLEVALKAFDQGKDVLTAWDKHTGRWSEIVKGHNSNSVVDTNRRTVVNAAAQVTAEMMMSDFIDSFINSKDISESDRLDAIGRKTAFDAASGNPKEQAKIFSAFNKWASGKIKSGDATNSEGESGLLDEEGERVYKSLSPIPTLEELGIQEGTIQANPKAEAYQKELDELDQQRNEGILDAKGYDKAVRKLKNIYMAQGYNPDPPKSGKNGWSHNVPHDSLFHEISNDEARATLTQDVGNDLNETLKSLGVNAEVDGSPQVDSNETTYFVKLGDGVQPATVKRVLEAIKNEMGENGIRMDSVVNGKPGYVAMHIPNRMQDVVGFNKFFEDPDTKMALETGLVPIPIGRGPNGKMMLVDIASSPTPHALIGGATKSGKSVEGHNIIAALLMKDSKMCSPVIIDPKGNEFTAYKGINGVGYSANPQSAIKALLAQQAERRKILTATGCRNIQEYNAKYPDHPMPYMPVVFDEMTQALQNAGGPEGELAKDVGTLARLARDTGISIIGLTQNADAKSIPSELKNQLGFRMAFRTQTEAASRDLLGLTASQNGNVAKGLKGAGDGYIKNPDDTLSRFQAAYIPQSDIAALVKWRKARDDGRLESTRRTQQDIANEAREARWEEVQKQQQNGQIVGGEVTVGNATPEQWKSALSQVPRVRLSSDPSNHMTRLDVTSLADSIRNGTIRDGMRFVDDNGNVMTYAGKYRMSNGLEGVKMIDANGVEHKGLPMQFGSDGIMYDAEGVGKYLDKGQESDDYIVDVGSVGGDPGTALQFTASKIISNAKNLTKAEALGQLDRAYQHYVGSVSDESKRQDVAKAYNALKSEMNENRSGVQYRAESSGDVKTDTANKGAQQVGAHANEPPQVKPEDIVSPEEAQQIAKKQADRQRFSETHKRYHPETQEGEEELENQTYEEEANQIYAAHEEGKLTGEKFRKRLQELDRGHNERINEIRDKYSKKTAETSKEHNQSGDNGEANGNKSQETNGIKSGEETTEGQDPLDMFLNPTSEQTKKFAEQEYREESDKIIEEFKAHKITREDAIERAKEARARRDKMLGKAKDTTHGEGSEKPSNKESDEEALRNTVNTVSHGKPIAHAMPNADRGRKESKTPISHQDYNAISKALPQDFVIEGGENAMRDGSGNVWAHHKGGNGNGSRGWFDKNNQWHWAVNTTHPKYKGVNSPEAKAAKEKWLSNNLNEAQNGREYRNIAFGTDEAPPSYGLDSIDDAILQYFQEEIG